MIYYLIGSLRNPDIREIGNKLRSLGHEIFDDWHAAGPEADDHWKEYEIGKGNDYKAALQGHAAKHVFEFDLYHLNRADGGILVLPAGKSGHLELGYIIGQGKPGYVLFPNGEKELRKLPDAWQWLTGVFEGEGSITRNGKRNGHGMQLTVTMKDEDIVRRLHGVSKVGSVEGPYVRDNPKWSPMWRWSVRKKADVLYVMKGMLEYLGERRKNQFETVLRNAGVSDLEIEQAKEPHEARYDVMYQFATGIFFNKEELYDGLK